MESTKQKNSDFVGLVDSIHPNYSKVLKSELVGLVDSIPPIYSKVLKRRVSEADRREIKTPLVP